VSLLFFIAIMFALLLLITSTKFQLKSVATSTGVRNKKNIVSTDNFFIDIPESIEHSFYNCKVFVSYKDTLFQPSNATEFIMQYKVIIAL